LPSCISVEMNGVLQNLIIEIARDNPAEHFVPTSSQWLIRGYKTAYRLGFPACFSCTMNGIANCTEIEACGSSTCFEWYEAYKCESPVCPSINPPCLPPCPGPAITLNATNDRNITVGECFPPLKACILCGYQ